MAYISDYKYYENNNTIYCTYFNITNMYQMFENATSFNQDISEWDFQTIISHSDVNRLSYFLSNLTACATITKNAFECNG